MENKGIHINWETTLERAGCPSITEFALSKNKELLLAYNKLTQTYFTKKGIVATIKEGVLTTIFETTHTICSLVVTGQGDIFVGTFGAPKEMIGKDEKCKLIKINSNNIVAWEHEFHGIPRMIPIVYHDSVFIYDHVESNNIGYFGKFDMEGDMVCKKKFRGSLLAMPMLLEDKKQIMMVLSPVGSMIVLDLQGNVLHEKKLKPWNPAPKTFSRGNNGEIYACLNQVLMQLDDNFNAVWEYKPVKGFISDAPVVDRYSNLYGKISGTRIVSLDPGGKERWISEIWGDVACQPVILDNGDILVASYKYNGRKAAGDIHSSTFLQIFSPGGAKLFEYEIVSNVVDIIKDNNNTIYLYSGHRKVLAGEKWETRFVSVYSVKILN
jgi:hypothetical protein